MDGPRRSSLSLAFMSAQLRKVLRKLVFQPLSQTADRLTQAPKATDISKPAKTAPPDVVQITTLFEAKDFLTPLRPLPTRPRRPAAATITAPTLSTVKVNSLKITISNSTEAKMQTEPSTSELAITKVNNESIVPDNPDAFVQIETTNEVSRTMADSPAIVKLRDQVKKRIKLIMRGLILSE